MATVATQLNSGTGFSSGETVTASKLNNLVNTATVTGIVNADIGAGADIAASKLAATLDLSSKTVTLPDSAIAASKLAATLDLSSKTVTLPDSNIVTAKIADAAVTAAKLSGAQTGAAPIYGCRAWVNFDATTADNLTATYTRSGTDVTIVATAHKLIVGNVVRLDFTAGTPSPAADGTYTVTAVDDANTFHVTTAASGTITAGSVTLLRRQIRASGNVASVTYHNTAGVYTVNFSTALPDENYAVAGFANWTTSNPAGFVTQNDTHAPTALACGVRVAGSTTAAENNVSHVNVMFIR